MLAACDSGSGGPINIPPPPSPRGEPTPLAQTKLNINHIHALAVSVNSRTVLIGTHHDVRLAVSGASPRPLSPGLSGDVLQVLYGAGGAAYAAGHNLGVQVSRNGGASWAPVSRDVAGLDVHGLVADPRDLRQMIAYAVGHGILTSSDAGAHWTHRPGYADSHYLTGLAVTADGTLLAGSPDLGLAASPDHGATFDSVQSGTGPVYSIAASETSADVVVVAAENGIFLTQNGGKDWAVGVAISGNVVTGVGVDAIDPHHLYAGDANGQVFTSTDSGNSWSPL